MGWSPEKRVASGDVRDEALMAVLESVIAQPGVGVAGIGTATQLDEAVVAARVEDLVSLGVLKARDDTEQGWSLVHPRSALNGLLADRERRLAVHMDELAEARQLVDRLSDVFANGGRHIDSPGVVTLRNRAEVTERLTDLGREVQNEVCSFVTVQPPPQAAVDGRELDRLLLDRGVTLRMICLEAFYRDAAVARHLIDSAEMGLRIRTRPTLPTRMLVFDRRVAVLPLDPSVSGEGAVVIDHGTIVHLLHSLFEIHWKDSDPLSATAPAQPAVGPRPMELAILNLLALGHKDEAIARSTGQSTRTVRRLVAGLAVTLNARSRFDLALRAAARGWIDSPFD